MPNNDLIVVTSRSFSKNTVLRKELIEKYNNVRFNDEGLQLKGADLIRFLEGAQKVIVGLEQIDNEVFQSVPTLKVVSKYGVGLDSLKLADFTSKGVALGWSPGVNKRSVSELALYSILGCLRGAFESLEKLKSKNWKNIKGYQLTGKTVGILGLGNIGRDLVKLLRPFSVDILYHDILEYESFSQEYSIKSVGLEDLFRQSDIVTLHVPLDSSTKGIVGSELLSLMKPNGVLINTARGGLVVENDLYNCLKDKKILASFADVFEDEPANENPLLSLDNFFGSTHIGGSSFEAILAMGRAAILGLDNNEVPK